MCVIAYKFNNNRLLSGANGIYSLCNKIFSPTHAHPCTACTAFSGQRMFVVGSWALLCDAQALFVGQCAKELYMHERRWNNACLLHPLLNMPTIKGMVLL